MAENIFESSYESDLKTRLLVKYPKAQGENALCIIECNHDGEEMGNMIRCCMCAHWFHTDCLDLDKDEAGGVWPCYTCRFISHDILCLQQTINKLLEYGFSRAWKCVE